MKVYKKANEEFVVEFSREEFEWNVAMPFVEELIEQRFMDFLRFDTVVPVPANTDDVVNQIAEVLGQEAMEEIVANVESGIEEEASQEGNRGAWELFKHGSEEEQRAFHEERDTHYRHRGNSCRCPLPNKIRKDGSVERRQTKSHFTDWD